MCWHLLVSFCGLTSSGFFFIYLREGVSCEVCRCYSRARAVFFLDVCVQGQNSLRSFVVSALFYSVGPIFVDGYAGPLSVRPGPVVSFFQGLGIKKTGMD